MNKLADFFLVMKMNCISFLSLGGVSGEVVHVIVWGCVRVSPFGSNCDEKWEKRMTPDSLVVSDSGHDDSSLYLERRTKRRMDIELSGAYALRGYCVGIPMEGRNSSCVVATDNAKVATSISMTIALSNLSGSPETVLVDPITVECHA
ncbi:hypothetical protein V6N12_029738 [Hibiscus sabdariffa]|uniref:Uncharacterized protein n=1 Tax=Hibiscus sabdariffa TaxID=183260 RepID=A0ABR2CX07_9ROSI